MLAVAVLNACWILLHIYLCHCLYWFFFFKKFSFKIEQDFPYFGSSKSHTMRYCWFFRGGGVGFFAIFTYFPNENRISATYMKRIGNVLHLFSWRYDAPLVLKLPEPVEYLNDHNPEIWFIQSSRYLPCILDVRFWSFASFVGRTLSAMYPSSSSIWQDTLGVDFPTVENPLE